MEDNPSYYSILTAEVRYDKELTPLQKLLYSEITALANKTGVCWASNAYFAELYGVTDSWVSTSINQLVKRGYIKSTINQSEGNIRHLSIVGIQQKQHTYSTKVNDPYSTKVKHNNTSINNINNISKPTAHPQLGELLDLFKKVNPSYRLFFANKTQRACLQRLIEQHSYEKTKAMIELLPDLIDKPYAPVVTSPYELEKNLGKIIAYVAKERTKNGSKFAKMD